MPINDITSSFPNSSNLNIVQYSQRACDKAENKGRVTLSNVTKLLNRIECSEHKLSSFEFKSMKANLKRISQILPVKPNRASLEKSRLVAKSLERINKQLTVEADNALFNEAKMKAEEEIKTALFKIINHIPQLTQKLADCKFSVRNTITQLPTALIQQQARHFIDTENYSKFDADSGVAKEFFPTKSTKVLKGKAYVWKFEPDDSLSTWTSLGKEGPLLKYAEQDLSKARDFIKQAEILKEVVAGKLDYTEHTNDQIAMLAFADYLK
ncbi:hypothetical protein SC206_09285 [Rouxiella sp. T17]|uniref:hypothetical protein n=1 Tax=Rouxiella sp. T17 TaxID=3085684 RepID=UPI002FCBD34F